MSAGARGRVLAVFRPAAAVVGRLRYAQKFVVVGLVLLTPLGLVAGAYVQLQRSQIAFSAKERVGVEVMAPLLVLTGHVVEARRLAVAAPAAHRPDLAADVAGLDALDRRLGGTLQFGEHWQAARAKVLAAAESTGPGWIRYRAYNAAMDRLLALIVYVGDVSNLTLDPDLDTYYLMDILQFRLPQLLDQAGRGADRAALAAAAPSGMDTQTFIDLGLTSGALASIRVAIRQAVATIGRTTADDGVRQTSAVQFARLDATLADLGGVLTSAVQGRLGSAPAAADAVRAAAVRVHAAAVEQAAATAVALDALLQVRIDEFAARARRVVVGTGFAVLLAIYLFIGFYLSVAGPIRRIVGTLRAVEAGDLTQRVSVDTHDELSFVAKALNDTVAQTKVVTDRLATQATHDPLTALPNRAVVLDRLDRALHRAERTALPTAVLFIDLDRFKIINDSLGHDTGDEVLRTIAARLSVLLRPGDLAARLAGDEFVVICEQPAAGPGAVQLAERIVAALSEPITVRAGGGGEREVTVGASIGIALAGASTAIEPEEVLRDADVAMYRAKERGRGRVEIFDSALRVAVERRLETQDDLRRGLDAGQLRVHYQPILDLGSGLVVGFEALVRWQHPTRGLLGAGEFIEVAEETGLIVPLGAAVLAEACRQAAQWRADRPGCERLHIAVNVSAPQFSHPSFVPTVATVLADTGLDPDALWLEITETSIMADAEAIRTTLEAIRALGVHLAIDDFGTGYSSLAYLRRLPVEILKIDRSFVAGLGQNREDEAIVAMIASLAGTLDLHVVAEGVEDAGQLDQLRRIGCHSVQGFHLGPPSTAERAWDGLTRSAPAPTSRQRTPVPPGRAADTVPA